MENKELKLLKSHSVEKSGKKEVIDEIEEEVLARLEEIKAGNCVIGEGKTAKVLICEKDPWSCFKIISTPYYPRLRVDQEMKFLDEAIKQGIRVPSPLFSVIYGNTESLVMERINGHTIKEIIEDNLDLPQNFDFNGLFAEINDFLNKLHLHGIYHRDLHEGNVMIDEEGKPWIIDFGDATRSFDEKEAYTNHVVDSATRKLKTIRYTTDENNLAMIRRNLRNYIFNQK